MNAITTSTPRFSTYAKNVRVAVWIRRFIDNCRKKSQDRVTSYYVRVDEMRKAEKDLIHKIQVQNYPTPPVLGKLYIEKADDNLWHVRTKLTYRQDMQLFRSPILLPNTDELVHQLIEYVHTLHCHAGTQFVLGKLRERYWIPSGRKTVGRILTKCLVCRRFSAKNLSCEPAPLLEKRVQTQFAFETTGVDLAGPLVLKGGKKVWIVLYTCAVYRGIYLDTVDSLSADEFLDSLEKFTNLIGRPSHLFSDNGTNFVGADNMMKILNWKKSKLEERLHRKQIKWTFNPPSAPWWGGFWERLVRSVKDLLRRMLGTAKLSKGQLISCLASVSYAINNRPLTTLTEDDEDLFPLTPAMFMRDLPVSGLPERELISSRDLQSSYQKIIDLKRALRERFRKEYLANLVQRQNEKKTCPPKVNDVVLVGQENKKRYEWPLGIIVELYPGRDGQVRVARVKTKNGFLVRPLQRLYPLEVPTTSEKEVSPEVKRDATREITDQLESQDSNVVIKTRSGREVKKPTRYSHWNH